MCCLSLRVTPHGTVLASIHPDPMRNAMRAQRDNIAQRLASLPEALNSATHAHVLIHIEATTVHPWSLPDRGCVFATAHTDAATDRVLVALRDTCADPQPETTRALLHLMLASATDD